MLIETFIRNYGRVTTVGWKKEEEEEEEVSLCWCIEEGDGKDDRGGRT